MRLELELHRANERYLGFLVDSARGDGEPKLALVRTLRSWLIGLDEPGRIRAAERPYLLVDCRLKDAIAIEHREPRGESAELTRQVLWLIWNTVRFQPPRVGLRPGISLQLAGRMTEASFDDLNFMVEEGGAVLRPRWPDKLIFWRRLLEGAGIDDARALQSVDLHAAQLLAGELMGRAA